MGEMKPSEYHGCLTGDCPHEAVQDCINALETFCDEQHAEVRRLRAALEEIVEADKVFQFAHRTKTTMWSIARKALKGEA